MQIKILVTGGTIDKIYNELTGELTFGTSNLDEMLDYETYCQEIAGNSLDYTEGVAAFNEKRKAKFTGN